jgi:hypothetical protein
MCSFRSRRSDFSDQNHDMKTRSMSARHSGRPWESLLWASGQPRVKCCCPVHLERAWVHGESKTSQSGRIRLRRWRVNPGKKGIEWILWKRPNAFSRKSGMDFEDQFEWVTKYEIIASIFECSAIIPRSKDDRTSIVGCQMVAALPNRQFPPAESFESSRNEGPRPPSPDSAREKPFQNFLASAKIHSSSWLFGEESDSLFCEAACIWMFAPAASSAVVVVHQHLPGQRAKPPLLPPRVRPKCLLQIVSWSATACFWNCPTKWTRPPTSFRLCGKFLSHQQFFFSFARATAHSAWFELWRFLRFLWRMKDRIWPFRLDQTQSSIRQRSEAGSDASRRPRKLVKCCGAA